MIGYLEALVFVLFVAAAVFMLGWQAHVSWAYLHQPETPPPAAPPPLPSTMTHALPRAGRLDLDPFAGAADPAQQLQPFDPLLVLADALTIAERWQERDQVSLEVAAIIAEVEANPDQWRHR